MLIFTKAIFKNIVQKSRLMGILLFLTLKGRIWRIQVLNLNMKHIGTRLLLMPLLINRTKGRVINTSLLSPACKALSTFWFQSLLLPACKKNLAGVYRPPWTRTTTPTSIVAGSVRCSPADPIVTNACLSLSLSGWRGQRSLKCVCAAAMLIYNDKIKR